MVRSKSIREAAEGEICTWPGCGSPHGVVLAHSNMSIHGKAMKQKSHDCFAAFLCNNHHWLYDKGTGMSQSDKEWHFMRAMSKTLMRLIVLGIITINEADGMSQDTIEHAMMKIEYARPESPIAVFKSNQDGHVNAMFADTIKTKERIARCDPDLIGVFDATMNQRHIRAMLEQASRPPAIGG